MNDDNIWRWDDTKAVDSEGEQAQKEMDALLMRATGARDPDEAVNMLLGRPRAGQPHEETVRLQVRVPESWQKSLDRQAKTKHLSRSEYLRQLLGKAAMQTA
ncbi:hypothetical protein [Bifidobacterium tibiigranuli]|jgi:hypothetical protein|uniref:Toxin-antitoxin system protein n=1 Tax=Bifidobacterium tibiigranuli TaxID=2172043 RepID=A0A5N6RWW3_9BIFI|nr:hypothetical protein [Bifidobacterium tibiigranuli]MCI1223721.1 ribbon-helix-helix domain-containing protein [Bifidobacterium subtile]KAE8126749.1 hypothetical protein DDE84_10215 [Bifidobacterium tibiigranuli]KAE8126832.1 hypothetical protein DDF78_10095 [Bifidobacterium tibiigranuli]MCI1650167.1 ribbon-helix-helix domain-containing protein [Bifidobacterium tibiigranuli]MCI1673085.1 ribbon-helix-helix domain-containing protein [Bifidobacterium tibiigranuli]